jgi:hypothetical protein
MAKKITYLLGAGASANSIPVVAFMYERLSEVLAFLRLCLPNTPSYVKKPAKIPLYNLEILNHIILEFEWVLAQSGNYYTIDTLAKKYYLTNNKKSLRRLKKCLILYFTIEQLLNIENVEDKKRAYRFIKEPVDKRYSNFIAAIMKKRYPIAKGESDSLAYDNLGYSINENIKILSWNYDCQIELCLKEYTGTILHHVKKEFQIFPNKKSYREVNRTTSTSNRFAVVKLNGDACWDKKIAPNPEDNLSIFDGNWERDNEELLISYLDSLQNVIQTFDQDLSNLVDFSPALSFNFAWEKDPNFNEKYPGHNNNIEAAEQIADETEILVVIGYSFPIFNREIDNKLFKKMERLTKVYVQDREPDKIQSTMVNAFEVLQKEIKKVSFHLESNINQFIIPFELYQE